jgi:energy-coupling factor transporter ATP-binding protein EcfA2
VLLEWRNVLDNVLLQLELRGLDPKAYVARAHELLAKVGLGDFHDRRPRELSGGMRQRAAIVRALIHDPPLLMMDEPFGALDALTREQMRIDLEELWMQTGKTVLFITHSIDEAVLLADRVIVMSPRPGKIEQVYDIPLSRPLPTCFCRRRSCAGIESSPDAAERLASLRASERNPGTPARDARPRIPLRCMRATDCRRGFRAGNARRQPDRIDPETAPPALPFRTAGSAHVDRPPRWTIGCSRFPE